ncbi:MAG: DUF3131 domain-containing protein [Pseudomonadota bacterium]
MHSRDYLTGSNAFVFGLMCVFFGFFFLDLSPKLHAIDPLVELKASSDRLRSFGELRRPLTENERAFALKAWSYLEANTRETGFVDSVENYPSSTLWDQGSYLLGVISARKLDLIDQELLKERGSKFVASLSQLTLVEDRFPNKVYNTQTLEMVDYSNTPVQGGVGWSVLDLGRLLSGLSALSVAVPELRPAIHDVVLSWDLSFLGQDGELIGAYRDDDEGVIEVQEGRLGYEQYAARAVALWGVDSFRAQGTWDRTQIVNAQGVQVPADMRDPARFDAIDPVTSEPFFLHGLEFGLTGSIGGLTYHVYDLQKQRSHEVSRLVFVSEDHLDRAPYFAYNSIYGNERFWTVMDEEGHEHPDAETQSMKAVFAWFALFQDDYATAALEALAPQLQTDRGWFAGLYSASNTPNTALTLNTNAIILQSLAYITHGPIHQWDAPERSP